MKKRHGDDKGNFYTNQDPEKLINLTVGDDLMKCVNRINLLNRTL